MGSSPVIPIVTLNWFQALAALRPGGYHTFTLLGKIISQKPLMRYQVKDYRPSGREQTAVHMTITGPPGHGPRLSNDARTLLKTLREWSIRHDVRVAYSLPWGYTPPEKEAGFQRENINFLRQVNEFIPVLKDPLFGADTNIDHFADTGWHLAATASALRTDQFGQQIKDWDIWTEAELRRRENQP